MFTYEAGSTSPAGQVDGTDSASAGTGRLILSGWREAPVETWDAWIEVPGDASAAAAPVRTPFVPYAVLPWAEALVTPDLAIGQDAASTDVLAVEAPPGRYRLVLSTVHESGDAKTQELILDLVAGTLMRVSSLGGVLVVVPEPGEKSEAKLDEEEKVSGTDDAGMFLDAKLAEEVLKVDSPLIDEMLEKEPFPAAIPVAEKVEVETYTPVVAAPPLPPAIVPMVPVQPAPVATAVPVAAAATSAGVLSGLRFWPTAAVAGGAVAVAAGTTWYLTHRKSAKGIQKVGRTSRPSSLPKAKRK